MKLTLLGILTCGLFAASQAAPAAAPVPKAETLHFNVNWPSGLSLGEGELSATPGADGWSFSLRMEAAIPAFAIVESATSRAGVDLCSSELLKEATRGRRQMNETTKFDAAGLVAIRTTKNGGKSETRTNACAKDALTFIQFVRRELAAGRVPPSQSVYYGAAYQTRLQYTGTTRIQVSSGAVETDKLTATIKGPASEMVVDLFFARDEARTPVLVQIPVTVGKFSVEFSR